MSYDNTVEVEIWYYDHGVYKVYTNVYRQKKQIEDLRRVVRCNTYFIPKEGRAWDFLVPIGALRKVKKILSKQNNGGIFP